MSSGRARRPVFIKWITGLPPCSLILAAQRGSPFSCFMIGVNFFAAMSFSRGLEETAESMRCRFL
jgi:hypothetical protein